MFEFILGFVSAIVVIVVLILAFSAGYNERVNEEKGGHKWV